MEIQIRFKRLSPLAQVPQYATPGAAAADLRAALETPVTLLPGERALIPTGLAIEPERENVVAVVCARSGLASKKGIALANGIGVVDSDYRGEIRVALVNLSDQPFTVENGERIAQLMILPVFAARFTEAETLRDTVRGEGGFGSTGTH